MDLLPLFLLAQAQPDAGAGAAAQAQPSAGAGLALWVVLLAAMALAPFVLTMVTSFAKLVVVGSILRHALGTQQIPPTTVITGLALILTLHIMAPVGIQIYGEYTRATEAAAQPADGKPVTTMDTVRRVGQAAEGPLHDFMYRHARPENLRLFEDMREQLSESQRAPAPPAAPAPGAAAPAAPAPAAADAEIKDPLVKKLIYDLTVLTPAFMLSQLTEAFQIGFLLFVPFLIIDLVVSNILMAMGMQMMSPVTISMPLKMLLFVLVDGWRLIMRGLVLSYT